MILSCTHIITHLSGVFIAIGPPRKMYLLLSI